VAARPSRWGSSVFQRAAPLFSSRRLVAVALRHLHLLHTRGRVWVFTRGAASSHARTDARGSGSSRSDFVDSRLGLHARGCVISRAARGRTRGAAGLHARTSSTRGSRPTCTCVARAPVFTRAQAAICRPTSCCPLGNVPLLPVDSVLQPASSSASIVIISGSIQSQW
jgi:hypothetical protein